MNELHKRKPTRLKKYDYSKDGYYFITICADSRNKLFGDVINDRMVLNEHGRKADDEVKSISMHYPNVLIDNYVIMPNHVHLIVVLVGAPLAAPENARTGAASGAPTVGNIIRGYKSGVSRQCGFTVWQRNYHDHVIRNEQDYLHIFEYIENNPLRWHEDCFYE